MGEVYSGGVEGDVGVGWGRGRVGGGGRFGWGGEREVGRVGWEGDGRGMERGRWGGDGGMECRRCGCGCGWGRGVICEKEEVVYC